MATKIKHLKDEEGKFYPYTHESAVVTDDGTKLGDKLTQIGQELGEMDDDIEILNSLSAEEIEREKYRRMYLTIEALEEGTYFNVFKRTAPTIQRDIDLQYSLDNGVTWQKYTIPAAGQYGAKVNLSVGKKILLKGNNPDGVNKCSCYYDSALGSIKFTNDFAIYLQCSGKAKAYGNIISLISGDDYYEGVDKIPDGCFSRLFQQSTALVDVSGLYLHCYGNNSYVSTFAACSSLVNTPKFPNSKLYDGSCAGMFLQCTSLKDVYELPVKDLSYCCYVQMFQKCSGLSVAPKMQIVKAEKCSCLSMYSECVNLTDASNIKIYGTSVLGFNGMFKSCTKLVNAPELPAEMLADYCYQYMFSSCSSLVNAPELPAEMLADYCYREMFYNCASLENAPKLPAKQLAYACYGGMFYGCSSLESAPSLNAESLASNCYDKMFSNCTGLTQIPSLSFKHTSRSGCIKMFEGCINLVNAPILKAKDVQESCYEGMFNGCSKLNKVGAEFVTFSSEGLANWLNGVSPTGTFIMADDAEWNPEDHRGANGVPEGWTIERVTRELDADEKFAKLEARIAAIKESVETTGEPLHEESDKIMHHVMTTLGIGASWLDLVKIYNKIEELEMANKRHSLDASLTIPTISLFLTQQATLNITAANATLANNLQMEIIGGTISDSITKSVSGSVATFKFTPSSYGEWSYYLYDSTDNRMSSVKKINVLGGPTSQPTYVASARKVMKTNGDHEYIVSVFAWNYSPSGMTFSYTVDSKVKQYIGSSVQEGYMSNGKCFAVGSFAVPKDDFEGKVNVVKGFHQGRTTNITLTNTEEGFTLEEEEGLIDDMLLDE